MNEIEVLISQPRASVLTLRFSLTGDSAELRIPAERASRFSDRLWEQTCFEAFLRTANAPDYFEFNLSPSGEWAVYRFSSYRQPAPAPVKLAPPELVRHNREGGVEVLATLDLSALDLPEYAKLQLGLSAVIEQRNGALSYWALRHPPGKPDFHHTDSFSLELDGGEET